MMCKVGVQLQPQATTVPALRAAAIEVEQAGFDSLWTWDHFFPLSGDQDGAHFEGWTLLTAFAADTSRITLGHLVTCMGYRNPHLLADMARTVDHIAGGRLVLGLGAGWFRRDYDEYELPFGTPGGRLRDLEANLYRLKRRLTRLSPPPVGDLPILIGGGGEQITLRLVAEHALLWNGFGPPETFAAKNRVLDRWCETLGRDPSEIERTVLIRPEEAPALEAFIDAGAEHVIVGCGHPFDLEVAHGLLEAARA